MKLIVGLGNPGKKYEKTRHNVGWQVLDLIARFDREARRAGKEKWNESKKAKTLYLKTEINGQPVELLKPTTFMNNSGQAVAYAFKKHNLDFDDVWVIYDDIDLPVGTIKVGQFDSSGGHKGVQSIIDHLKTKDFIRFRIGIKNDKVERQSSEKFVLKKFGRSEKSIIDNTIQKTIEAINLTLTEPLEKVMNEYN